MNYSPSANPLPAIPDRRSDGHSIAQSISGPASLPATPFQPNPSPLRVSPSSLFEMTESAVAESQIKQTGGQTPPQEPSSAGVCCGHSQIMGMELAFACNARDNKELEARDEKRFRMLWQPIMSRGSPAQRLPRQRLSANCQRAHRRPRT